MKMLKKRRGPCCWTLSDRRQTSATIIIYLSWAVGDRKFNADVVKRNTKFDRWPAQRTATPEEMALARAHLTEQEVAECMAASLGYKGHYQGHAAFSSASLSQTYDEFKRAADAVGRSIALRLAAKIRGGP